MRRRTRESRAAIRSAYVIDLLENRRLLSTINWTNVNSFSGSNDNRFDDVFGSLQNQAIAVVQAAINDWQKVITNFNYTGGGNTFSLTISMASSSSTGAGAVTTNILPTSGKPSSATITINWKNIAASGNDDAGWFLDPTPNDNSEFSGAVTGLANEWVGQPFAGTEAAQGADLFAIVLHEIGHAVGLVSNSTLNSFSHVTTSIDNVDTPASNPLSLLYTFDSTHVHTLWTEYNTTGGTGGAPQAVGGAEHSAPAGTSATLNGRSYSGYADLMNANNNFGRAIMSDTEALMLEDAYGYTVAMPSAVLGTFYDTLDADGTLRIDTSRIVAPGSDSGDAVTISSDGSQITVGMALGSPALPADSFTWTSNFPLASVTNIQIKTGAGADHVMLEPTSNSIPISVFMGNNSEGNELDIVGSAGNDSISLSSTALTSTGLNVSNFSGVDLLDILPAAGTADVSITHSVFLSNPVHIDLTAANSTLNLHSLVAGMSTIIHENTGNDTINVGPDNVSAAIASPVTINSANGTDIVNLGGGSLNSITGPVTTSGGSINLNDQSQVINLDYDITSTAVTSNFLFGGLTYSGASKITINAGSGANTFTVHNGISTLLFLFGNDGDDTFNVGDGHFSSSSGLSFNGGNGIDTIDFDDHLDSTNLIWDIRADEVLYGGLVELDTTGFENVSLQGGEGNDTYTFAGNLDQNITVDGGEGNDSFQWNAANTQYRNSGVTTSYNVDLDAGSDQGGTLVVNDASRGVTQYQISDSSFTASTGTGPTGQAGIFTFENFSSLGVTSSTSNNSFDVTGVGLLGGITLNAGSGNDSFTLSQSPLTLSPVFINTGGGSDSLVVDDSSFSDGLVYSIGATTINRADGILSSTYSFDNGIQAITILGSQGDDTFNFTGNNVNRPKTINGEGGNDTFNIGGSLLGNSQPKSISLDGGDGLDTFNLDDESQTSAHNYVMSAGLLTRDSTQTSYSNVEGVNINCGSGNDFIEGVALGAGVALTFNGNAGNDTMSMSGFIYSVTQGTVIFDGGDGNNTLGLANDFDPTGQTLHVTPNSIATFPGDRFFAPGGALFYYNTSTLDVFCSNEADAVFVQPSATTAMLIEGDNPNTAPGDSLTFALGDTVNPVFTGTPASGSLTGDNIAKVTYVGFETGPTVDDVAPFVTDRSFSDDFAPHTLTFDFSEDVSQTLEANGISVINADTSDAIPVQLFDYDTVNNIATYSFAPASDNGVLPDGNYLATVPSATTLDAAGNPLIADSNSTLDFFHLTADANHDRAVDTADFTILADHFNQSGVPFSQGDFNYDGVVNALDFNALATNFGSTLSPPAPATRALVNSARGFAPVPQPQRNLFGSVPIEVRDVEAGSTYDTQLKDILT